MKPLKGEKMKKLIKGLSSVALFFTVIVAQANLRPVGVTTLVSQGNCQGNNCYRLKISCPSVGVNFAKVKLTQHGLRKNFRFWGLLVTLVEELLYRGALMPTLPYINLITQVPKNYILIEL